jgi:Amt family ammonium transporter
MAALVIGLVAGVVCFLCVQIKFKFGFDDSLDVIAVHLVGGITGSILLGVFANEAFGGLLSGGGASLLGKQIVAVAATLAYSGVMSFILAKIIDKTIGLRISADEEAEGLDLSQHAESAYAAGEFGSMGRVG